MIMNEKRQKVGDTGKKQAQLKCQLLCRHTGGLSRMSIDFIAMRGIIYCKRKIE
jgi:hypothetical protein